jgi:hypothetical protein
VARPGRSAERRDDRAAERDDAAERRDVDSRYRDVAADRRDTRALERDDRSADRAGALHDRLDEIRRLLRAHLRRIEKLEVDPAEWPGFTPAGLALLATYVTEQGRLAALDSTAVSSLLDDFGEELRRALEDQVAGSRDRNSSAVDRHGSERDRDAAAVDRDGAAADRGQAAIEREQADSADRAVEAPTATSQVVVDESVAGRVRRAVEDSRHRVVESRKHLGPMHGYTGTSPAAPRGRDPAHDAE